MERLGKLKRIRNGHRTQAQRLITEIEEILNDERLDSSSLELKCLGLKKQEEKIKKLDEDIEGTMDEADVEDEINDAVVFSSKMDEAIYLADKKLQEKTAEDQATQEQGHNSNHHAKTGRLPKLELPIFDGEPKKWFDFWDVFNAAIHTRSDLAEIEKLQYLKGQLKGAALKLIDGFRLTAVNYEMVLEMLHDAYGDRDAIIDAHIIELVELSSPCDSSVQAIEIFRTDMESHLRELEALGIEMTKYGRVLSPLLMKKLPSKWKENIIRNTGSRHPTLDELRASLGAEMLTMKATEVDQAGDRAQVNKYQRKEKPWTKKTLVSQAERAVCELCTGDHHLQDCQDFEAMDLDQRLCTCRTHGLCFRCLRGGHLAAHCRSFPGCNVDGCKGKHHTLLHAEHVNGRSSGTTNQQSHHSEHNNRDKQASQQYNRALSTAANNIAKAKVMVFQTVPVYVETGLKRLKLNALLDPCSDSSYISQEAADELGVTGTPWTFELTTVKGAEEVKMKKAPVTIASVDNYQTKMEINVFVTEDLVGSTDAFDWSKAKKQWTHMADIPFPALGKKKVDVLIGVTPETMCLFTPEKQAKGESQEPVAVKTPFGWTAFGPVEADLVLHQEKMKKRAGVTKFVRTMRTTVNKLSVEEEISAMRDMTEMDLMGIKTEEEMAPSHLERITIDRVKTSIKHDGERYEVAVPWRDAAPDLPSNYASAESRLVKLERSLLRNPDADLPAKYDEIFASYVDKGYLVKLTGSDVEPAREDGWFLPHFPVIRNDKSSTRVRVVYDAAAKYKGTSLNSQIFPGPSLYNDMTEVLLRFRQHPVALVGDVSEMFLQVRLSEDDKKYHRLLWRSMDMNSEPQIYEAQRWLFGNAAAPFCTQLVIQENAKEHHPEYPVAADVVLNNFYMDDALTSYRTEAEALEAKEQLVQLMNIAGMKIHKWMSNSEEVLANIPDDERAAVGKMDLRKDDSPCVKTLGVRWMAEQDMFAIKITEATECFRFTKRNCLRRMATVFDPLCFFAPYLITAKILFQQTWEEGIDWDDQMPAGVEKEWREWFKGLKDLEAIEVPRCMHPFGTEVEILSQSLHVFSDASERAYAAAVYMVTETTTGERSSVLVLARARVAPTKTKQTIPRLELVAAVLGLRLAKKVCKATEMPLKEVHFWCDAMDVLCWLRNDVRRFQTFVANRVAEIKDSTDPDQWQHCPGSLNSADLPTRGLTATELIHSQRWWTGPEFLVKDEKHWPVKKNFGSESCDQTEFRREHKNKVTLVSSVKFEEDSRLNPSAFSSWTRLKRVTAWIFRYIENLKKAKDGRLDSSRSARRSQTGRTVPELDVEELQQAEEFWVREAQKNSFSRELSEMNVQRESANDRRCRPVSDSSIRRLCPELDSKGLIRVGGRLQRADLPYGVQHPLLLPKNNSVTKLIIQHVHDEGDHQLGLEHTLAELRQRYWIVHGREAIKKYNAGCPECIRRRRQPAAQIMAPKLEAQVKPSFRAFAMSAVDYAGPFETKQGRGKTRTKRYLCLFTCLQTRCVHLELAYGLDTDSFLRALDRFVARRGVPDEVWSDNGTNFVRADREIRQLCRSLDDQNVKKHVSKKGVKWHFNPPGAPHFGGAFEAMVKLVKRTLYRTLASASLSDEELQTAFCQAEALINSRPLTPLSSDPRDSPPLTPAHFLIGNVRTELEPTADGTESTHQKRWRRLQQVSLAFWRRWVREYLPLLQPRTKWTEARPDLQEGDIVLLQNSTTPRGEWPLGRITKTFKGEDDRVRVVEVLSKGKLMKRPAVKLVKLEVSRPSAR